MSIYKLKRIVKDVLGWDLEGRLSRRAWLSRGNPDTSHHHDNSDSVMVSLTTIPSRIDRVHVTIESILRQELRPIRVVLWLTATHFPNLLKLPTPLLRQMRRGLEIYNCDTDWPHQKLLPSLKKWPSNTIVTADDDIIYPVEWLQNLYNVHKDHPGTVVCRRARVMRLDASGALSKYETWQLSGKELVHPSHAIFPTGVGGALYPPGVLHDDVHNKALAERMCPRADDIWFKVMAFRKGTQCVATSTGSGDLPALQGSQEIALKYSNLDGGGNDSQLTEVLNYFNIEPKIFIESSNS